MKVGKFLLYKILDKILDNIITLIVMWVVLSSVTFLGSIISTGDWLEWFAAIPVPVRITLAGLFIAWILFIAIRRRIRHLHKENWLPPRPIRFKPSGGWETINKIKYAGVVWHVRVPVQASTFKRREVPTLDDLDMEIPPRCPDCETKLAETKSFWWWYVWKCVNCGFHKRNRDDCFREERQVIKLAERWFEETYQSQVEDGQ